MWPSRRHRRWLPLAVTLAVLLAACLVGAGLVVVAGTPPVPRTEYVEAVAGDPPLLNPLLARFTSSGQDVTPLVFSGLIRADPAGNLEPDLADTWEVDEAGTTYTVHLRDGLRWHDGEPLTADDVAFTVRLAQDPAGADSQDLADLWQGIEVEVLDAHTLHFRLPTPLASFAEHLTLGILPRHLLDGVSADALPLHPFNRHPIGSGPFRVASSEPERLVLERFPGYHGPAPTLERIELQMFRERKDAMAALLSGRVDGLANLSADEAARAAAAGLVVYALPERSKVAMLWLNVQSSKLQDAAVRRALALAIDREALIHDALSGQGEPAYGLIPVQSWAFSHVTALARHDPGASTALLDQAGWTLGADGIRQRDGEPLRFTLLTAGLPDRAAISRQLVDELAKVGVAVDVQEVPADELTDEYLTPRRYEAALVGQWTPGNDPDVYPQWHSSQIGRAGGNYAGFTDHDVDRWLEVGRQVRDPDARRNAYQHFQARWAEQQPAIMLYHPLTAFAVARDVWGVSADPLPDSSWRLRGATSWHRVTTPSPMQEARAAIVEWISKCLGR